MIDFHYKHISDPVYKTIALSELETEVINTPVFQRLRRVKHLGLVSLVYPGSDFSRFDHSLGVCHIMGRILSALQNANPCLMDNDKEIQKYRLASLLHDIGHYPFSHPMQEAIEEFYKGMPAFVEPKRGDEDKGANNTDPQGEETKFIEHEQVGREILRTDPDLKEIWNRESYLPEEISGVFVGSTDLPFGNLVKSDLDADRIDYLLRTAHHTGVPYGSIDLDYLISQMKFDKAEKRISLHKRALRSAEHLLLCRYFVYQQNIYHKTVAGLEWLLRDVLKALLEKKLVCFSKKDIKCAIEKKEWCNIDDAYVEGKIRALEKKPKVADSVRRKIGSIRNRKPVSLVYEWEVLEKREASGQFADKKTLAKICVQDAVEKYGIDESLWHVWHKKANITNLASRMNITDLRNDNEILQSVHLYDPNTEKSQVIMENKSSLMSVMADHALCVIRVYVLLPEDKANVRVKIKEYFERKVNSGASS